ncbi:zinc knuckle [Trichuris suis]|nr:zinc knuckle [Trichuris suis]
MEVHAADGLLDVKLIPEFDVAWPIHTGGALAVYLQLPDEDKENVEKLKNALLAAFEVDQFIAYEQFITRRLNPGELPDVFLADLQRLASLFGGVSERQLSCAFVTGLPDDVRRLLRAGSRIEEFSLAQLVTRARAVLTNNPFISKLDAGLAIGEPRMIPKSTPRNVAIRCYACGGANHLARDCLTRNRTNTFRRTGGHDAWPHRQKQSRDLPTSVGPMRQGNENGEGGSAPSPSRT